MSQNAVTQPGTGARRALLKEKLDKLYLSYGSTHIDSDPIQFPHRYAHVHDKEIAAFIAASLAYGSVKSMKKSLEKVFSVLGPHPRETIVLLKPKDALGLFKGFRHRFTTGTHVAWFLSLTRNTLRESGSLKEFFLQGYVPDARTTKESLVSFVRRLTRHGVGMIYQSREHARRDGALFLLPSPANGSACKRLNLFLRWMVRTSDALDLGMWPEVNPGQLVIPLDTHVARLSRYLGLTERKYDDWKTAEDITEELKTLDPKDPLKYDFSLSRLGILGNCTRKNTVKQCAECVLADICLKDLSG